MARPKPAMPPPAAILRVDRATGSLEKCGLTGVSDDPSRFLLSCHFPDAGRAFASCSVFRRPSALSSRTGRSRYRFPLLIGASRHSNLICMRFLCLVVRLPARVRVIGTPAFPGVRGRRPSALGGRPAGRAGTRSPGTRKNGYVAVQGPRGVRGDPRPASPGLVRSAPSAGRRGDLSPARRFLRGVACRPLGAFGGPAPSGSQRGVAPPPAPKPVSWFHRWAHPGHCRCSRLPVLARR